MSDMPSDKEIQAMGEHLGHGRGPYTTKLRAQIAKTIQLSRDLEIRERAVTTDIDGFVTAATTLLSKLRPSFSVAGSEAIVAALAPTIYRSTTERTPHK